METRDRIRKRKIMYLILKHEWSTSDTGKKKGPLQLQEFHRATSIEILSQPPSDEEMLLPPGG